MVGYCQAWLVDPGVDEVMGAVVVVVARYRPLHASRVSAFRSRLRFERDGERSSTM